MERPEAAEWLYTAQAAGRRTRRRRQAAWIPLAIFGVITLFATLLYRTHWSTTSPLVQARPLGFWNWLADGSVLRDPSVVSMYWLVSLVVGYTATVLLYRVRARRLGVATSSWPYAITGVGLLGLWIGFAFVTRQMPGALFIRGLIPLIVVGVG